MKKNVLQANLVTLTSPDHLLFENKNIQNLSEVTDFHRFFPKMSANLKSQLDSTVDTYVQYINVDTAATVSSVN